MSKASQWHMAELHRGLKHLTGRRSVKAFEKFRKYDPAFPEQAASSEESMVFAEIVIGPSDPSP